MRYTAIPLADRGFVPVSETNRVRWYVEREGSARLVGPFRNMAAADAYAADMNREEVTCKCGVYEVPYDQAHATDTTRCPSCDAEAESVCDTDREAWFWWSCFPGCLPDSDPFGPFASEDEALADAREGYDA